MKLSKIIGHSISLYLIAYFVCLGIAGSAMHSNVKAAGPGIESKFSDVQFFNPVISNRENVSLLFDNSIEETEEISEEDESHSEHKYHSDFSSYEQYLLAVSEKSRYHSHLPVFTSCNVPIYILFHSWKGFLI